MAGILVARNLVVAAAFALLVVSCGPSSPAGDQGTTGEVAISTTRAFCSPDGTLNAVGISWSGASGATGYEVLRDGTTIATLSSLVNEYLDRGPFVLGSDPTYVIRAKSSRGSIDSLSVTVSTADCSGSGTPPVPGPGGPPEQDLGATSLAAGSWSSIAVLGDGTVLAWGKGASERPATVPGLSGVTGVAAGASHYLALGRDGSVFAWGDNTNGQLGSGSNDGSAMPTVVPGVAGASTVVAGQNHSLALVGGTVYAWGSNGLGQLGNPAAETIQRSPVAVTGLGGVVAISAGGNHSLALLDDGSVYAWGSNSNGQLGSGSDAPKAYTPTPVLGLNAVVAISAGGSHSLALRSDGRVFSWGSNSQSQLGVGNNVKGTPVPLEVPLAAAVVGVAAGGSHSLAVLNDGTVLAWGNNLDGQLGNGGTSNSQTPVPVRQLSGVTAVAAGGQHSLARTGDGAVWAWGLNDQGQTSFDRLGKHVVPVRVIEQ